MRPRISSSTHTVRSPTGSGRPTPSDCFSEEGYYPAAGGQSYVPFGKQARTAGSSGGATGIPSRLQLTLRTTQAAAPQPTSYRSLALSPSQQLLDFFLPAPRAALQLPVLCHVGVHQAQKSTGILLQPGCFPLKQRYDDWLGVPASPQRLPGTTASSDGYLSLASCAAASYRGKRVGRWISNGSPMEMEPWERLSCWQGSREGVGESKRGSPGPTGTKPSPQRTQCRSSSGGTGS